MTRRMRIRDSSADFRDQVVDAPADDFSVSLPQDEFEPRFPFYAWPLLRVEQAERRRRERRARGERMRIRDVPTALRTRVLDFGAILAASAWIDEFGSLRAFRQLAELKVDTELQKQQLQAQIDTQRDEFKRRLNELEHAARRREWALATVVALAVGLVVGVTSILIAHFLFDF